MEDILQLAEDNQQRARQVLADSRAAACWQSIGAEVNLVGSLKMGLLMKHLDIDMHVYTSELHVADSFKAMSMLAENPRIIRIEYQNLLAEEDACLEWHAWYKDCRGDVWQLDMMHIVRGSRYDGYFEDVAERISRVLTPRQREIILRLKYDTPDDVKIMGIEYYLAVIRDGVSDYTQFEKWRATNPPVGIVNWKP